MFLCSSRFVSFCKPFAGAASHIILTAGCSEEKFMKRACTAFIIALLSLAAVASGKTTPPAKSFTIDDLMTMRRVGDPQISPDGRTVAYTITDTDKVANRRTTQIYLISVDGGEARQLTNEKVSSSAPRWSPDGRRL